MYRGFNEINKHIIFVYMQNQDIITFRNNAIYYSVTF